MSVMSHRRQSCTSDKRKCRFEEIVDSDVEIRESLHNIKLHEWMSSPKSKCRERERTEDRTVGTVYISHEEMAKKYQSQEGCER